MASTVKTSKRDPASLIVAYGGELIVDLDDLEISTEDWPHPSGPHAHTITVVRRIHEEAPQFGWQPGVVGHDTARASTIEIFERITFGDGLLVVHKDQSRIMRLDSGHIVHGNACPYWRPLPWLCLPSAEARGLARAQRMRDRESIREPNLTVGWLAHAITATLNRGERAHAAGVLLDVLPPTNAIDFLIRQGATPSPEWEMRERRVCSTPFAVRGDPLHSLAIQAWRCVRAIALELAFGTRDENTPAINGLMLDALDTAVARITGERGLVRLEDFERVCLPPKRGWANASPCVECACEGEITIAYDAEHGRAKLRDIFNDNLHNAPAGFPIPALEPIGTERPEVADAILAAAARAVPPELFDDTPSWLWQTCEACKGLGEIREAARG